MDITIGGRTVSLDGALPLTGADQKALKRLGINTANLDLTNDPDNTLAFLRYIIAKADTFVTQEEVDALTLGKIGEIFKAIGEAENLDIPFSAPSTSSPAPITGTSGISSG